MPYSLRYYFLLGVQIFLVVTDLLFNASSEFAKAKPELQLVLFIFQDVLIIISLTVMFVSFFSTYVFQAGLVELLFDRFRLTILMSVFYLVLTISLHIWLLTERWNNPLKYKWSKSLTSYFIFQRMSEGSLLFPATCQILYFHKAVSPLYYYSTKRAILRISDPIFYQSLNWISENVNFT